MSLKKAWLIVFGVFIIGLVYPHPFDYFECDCFEKYHRNTLEEDLQQLELTMSPLILGSLLQSTGVYARITPIEKFLYMEAENGVEIFLVQQEEVLTATRVCKHGRGYILNSVSGLHMKYEAKDFKDSHIDWLYCYVTGFSTAPERLVKLNEGI